MRDDSIRAVCCIALLIAILRRQMSLSRAGGGIDLRESFISLLWETQSSYKTFLHIKLLSFSPSVLSLKMEILIIKILGEMGRS